MTVGPSGPLLLNGTIRTESLRLLRFLSSRETISTQWRMGGLPKLAVQISPRRGSGLLIKVDPDCTLRERRLRSSHLHYRRPRSALVLRRLGDRLNMWMPLQDLAQRFAQDAHAAAMNYAHARHSGEECAVHESFDFARGVVHGAPDDVDLGRNALAFALQRD